MGLMAAAGADFYGFVMVTATGDTVNRRSGGKQAMIVKPLRRNKPG